jgi:hypothetical protein
MRADHASNRRPRCVSVGVLLVLGACGTGPPQSRPQTGSDAASSLPDTCPGICNAATPSYPQVQTDSGDGNVTMYDTAPSSGGACNYGTTSILYYAAMSVNVQPGDRKGQWQNGRICGQCVEVTALTSQGPQSVIVRITDKCPDSYCGIDLGGLAPAAIMLDGFGRYDGTWGFVSCTGHPEVSDGSPSLFVFAGSNAFWSRVQTQPRICSRQKRLGCVGADGPGVRQARWPRLSLLCVATVPYLPTTNATKVPGDVGALGLGSAADGAGLSPAKRRIDGSSLMRTSRGGGQPFYSYSPTTGRPPEAQPGLLASQRPNAAKSTSVQGGA